MNAPALDPGALGLVALSTPATFATSALLPLVASRASPSGSAARASWAAVRGPSAAPARSLLSGGARPRGGAWADPDALDPADLVGAGSRGGP